MIDKKYLDEIEYLITKSEMLLKEIKDLKQEASLKASITYSEQNFLSQMNEIRIVNRALFYSLLTNKSLCKAIIKKARKLNDNEVVKFIESFLKD